MSDFLIIGPQNAITYKEVFPSIKNNDIWLGCTPVKEFLQPDGTAKKFGNIGWFTNFEHAPAGKHLILNKRYSPENYPRYDNYDAIEVSRVSDIPLDYEGVMGVPITYIQYHCPDQFEIVGRPENLDIYGLKTRVYTNQECRDAYFKNFGKKGVYDLNASSVLAYGDKLVKTYNRILIRRKDRLEP